MRHNIFRPLAALALAAGVTAFGAAATFAASGASTLYPQVVASAVVSPMHPTIVHFETATVTIQPGTFSGPVRFEVLQGPLSGFMVPTGQQAIFDFAFRVTTLSGAPVPLSFTKPVVFTLRDPMIQATSQYDNVNLATGAITPNPKGLMIVGKTLSHPIATDAVGWVITSPAMP
jgi:hypothetical protein